MLVFVSMCPGDLASVSVLAAIARPPIKYALKSQAVLEFVFESNIHGKYLFFLEKYIINIIL